MRQVPESTGFGLGITPGAGSPMTGKKRREGGRAGGGGREVSTGGNEGTAMRGVEDDDCAARFRTGRGRRGCCGRTRRA